MSRASIPIKVAERLSEAYDCPVVIVFTLEGDGATFGMTTYGATKALCKHAADLGRQFAEAILKGTVTPSESDPMGIPDQPTEWEGKPR